MKPVIGALIIVILLGGCRKVDFVGEEYPSTDHVDLYCSWQDVQEDHRVIGHFVPADDDLRNIPKMRKQMLEAARKKGADALVIVGAGSCADSAESNDNMGTQALKAHQVKVSLLRYRVADDKPVDSTEATSVAEPG